MIRRLARPMLATVFVIDGVETLRNPQAHVAKAAPLVDKAAPLVEKGEQAVNEHVTTSVPPVTKDTETLVKSLAGVKVGAGVLFALGKAPRLSALALTASHLPTTVTRNDFWAESDSAARSRKTTGLATDVALLGALLLASVDTAGQPGLTWRARKAGDKVTAKLPGAKAESAAAGAALAGVAHNVADQARGVAGTVKDKAPEVADAVREKAPEVADQVREKAPEVADQVRDQAAGVAEVVRAKAPEVAEAIRGRAKSARKQAAPIAAQVRDHAAVAAHVAADQAAETREVARDRAAHVRDVATERAEKAAARADKVDAKDLRKSVDSATKKARKDARKKITTAKKSSDRARSKAAAAIRP